MACENGHIIINMKAKIDCKITRSYNILGEKLTRKGKHLLDRFAWRCDEKAFESEAEKFLRTLSVFHKFVKDYPMHPAESFDIKNIVVVVIAALYPLMEYSPNLFMQNIFRVFKDASHRIAKKDKSMCWYIDSDLMTPLKENNLTHVFADGSVYEGTVLNGKRQGHGELRCKNGGVYVGEWKNDKKHGFGTMCYANGSQYVGEFKYDKRYGFGIQVYKPMTSSDESKKCKKHGGIYAGEWKQGHRQGKGAFLYADGGMYEGEWLNSRRHGHGTFKTVCGVYEGEWQEGAEHGYGVYRYADGGVYEGEWNQGYRHKDSTISVSCTIDVMGEIHEDGTVITHDSTFATELLHRQLSPDACAETLSNRSCTSSLGNEGDFYCPKQFELSPVQPNVPQDCSQVPLHPIASEVSILSNATTCESKDDSSVENLHVGDLKMIQYSIPKKSDVYKISSVAFCAHLLNNSKFSGIQRVLEEHQRCASDESGIRLVVETIRLAEVLLLQKTPNVDFPGLMDAVRAIAGCQIKSVVNKRDSRTMNGLLHPLSRLNHIKAVQTLLANALVDVDLRDKNLCTPLNIVVMENKSIDMARALMKGNANPRLCNRLGLSALDYAGNDEALLNVLV